MVEKVIVQTLCDFAAYLRFALTPLRFAWHGIVVHCLVWRRLDFFLSFFFRTFFFTCVALHDIALPCLANPSDVTGSRLQVAVT